jgi:hypothetical protein
MEVETYEIEETTLAGGPSPEVESEAIKLIEDLGLEGQKELIVPSPRGEGDERIPYPEMSAHETRVYKSLFPQSTEVSKYNAGIIPVRVLQVIGHAQGLFEKVFVWHKRMRDPDPILVGIIGQKNYLLARWGSALKPFKELVVEAREVIREMIKAKCEEELRSAQRNLASAEDFTETVLRGEWIPVYLNF